MRLIKDDCVRIETPEGIRLMRLVYSNSAGTMAFADHNEANVDKRTRTKELAYLFKTAGSLQKARGRIVRVSPIGELSDPGFEE